MAARKQTVEDEKHGLMVRLPKTLHTSLRHVSIDRGQSLNTLITDVLQEWWAKQPEHRKYAESGSPPGRAK